MKGTKPNKLWGGYVANCEFVSRQVYGVWQKHDIGAKGRKAMQQVRRWYCNCCSGFQQVLYALLVPLCKHWKIPSMEGQNKSFLKQTQGFCHRLCPQKGTPAVNIDLRK